MKNLLPFLAVSTALLASTTAQAQYIYIDLSYKVILNPADGTRPPGVTDAVIDAAITGMNRLLDTYSRGYRMRRVDPITPVGFLGDTTGPSKWYSRDFLSDGGKDAMENEAQANSLYAWNVDAINIYVNAGSSGGICSFAYDFWYDDLIVILGPGAVPSADITLHEIGHYFNLYHTQGKNCGCCDTCDEPESDDVDDTLGDRACWGKDEIAMNAFHLPYASLNPLDQQKVDDTYFNIMSYRGPGGCGPADTPFQLTEGQLDRWTANAHEHREDVISGRTWYALPIMSGPFSLSEAVGAASANDIVLLLPGAYNQTLTINTAVTLRATRAGPAVIGAP